jgi:phosphate transport system permease protein
MQAQVDSRPAIAALPIPGVRSWRRRAADRLAAAAMSLCAAGTVLLVAAIAAVLLVKAWPVLSQKPLLRLLLSSSWRPLRGEFGFFPFIVGTLWVTLLAMAISVPVCLLAAVYLSEYAGTRMRAVAKPLIDLLAGIPPVVFGLCGMIAVVPLVERLGQLAGVTTTGFSVLAGGLILAIMVFPIIISVCEEVLQSVPRQAREASLALGATRWQTVKHVLLRAVYPGLSAAVILGFSRAFGETMAVLMVVGNVARPPSSVFDPAYPLPALIANQYGEMMTVRLYDSALMLAALMLVAVVLFFTVAARLVIRRIHFRLTGAA